MKPLIISFASKGREDYLKMSETLYRSVKEHWKYDYLFYTMDGDRDEFEGMKLTQITELPQPSTWHCNPHGVTPYQFKFGLIDHAREQGYDKIIWVDSSISLTQCPLHLLEQSNQGVMCFHNLGHETKDYISDECINLMRGFYSEYAPQIWGGCIGFDFTRECVDSLFELIIDASEYGAFNNSPTQPKHRHDQAVMSILFHDWGVLPYNYGHIVCNNPHGKEPFEYGKYHTFIYGK
jgi:hypothetical protein